MLPILKLADARLRMFGHVVTNLRRGGAFKFLVVTVFGILLVGMLFQTITFGFRFMRGYPEFQAVLVGYLFSVYFLTMLLMLVFSNAVISLGALYRSPETQLLMSFPLEARTVYAYKVSESLAFSSWAFLVLGGPLLAAYGLYGGMERAHWSFYPAAALLMLPFVFIPASVGAMLSVLLARFFPRRPGKALGLFFAAAAAVCLIWGVYLGIRTGLLEQDAMVNEAFVQQIMDSLAFSRSPWAPPARTGPRRPSTSACWSRPRSSSGCSGTSRPRSSMRPATAAPWVRGGVGSTASAARSTGSGSGPRASPR